MLVSLYTKRSAPAVTPKSSRVKVENELQLVDQTGGFGGENWKELVLTRINSGF